MEARKQWEFLSEPFKKVVTWKHSTRSPTLTFSHSKCSRARERTRTDFLIFTHSSSSAPNPTNLTRTSCVLPCSTDFYHLLSSKYRWMWIIIKAFLPTIWSTSYLSIPCNLSQSSMLDYISLSHSYLSNRVFFFFFCLPLILIVVVWTPSLLFTTACSSLLVDVDI